MEKSNLQAKDVKIGSKDEAKWNDVLSRVEQAIFDGKIEFEINKAIRELAKKKIEEEKRKI